jgi:hypothetical protein
VDHDHVIDAKITTSIVNAGGIEPLLEVLANDHADETAQLNACHALGHIAENGLRLAIAQPFQIWG